jgi:hypothetical protein
MLNICVGLLSDTGVEVIGLRAKDVAGAGSTLILKCLIVALGV